jgi:hypothetical protein
MHRCRGILGISGSFLLRSHFKIAFIVVLGGLFVGGDAKTWMGGRAALSASISKCAPEHVSSGIYEDRTGRPAVAPFEIITSAGHDYFVKLVDVSTGETSVTIFVRGGAPEEILVPLGRYKMRYVFGKTWCGDRLYFGDDTDAAKANDIFHFRETADSYEGYVVELILQNDGNLVTRSIDVSDF